MLYLVIKAMISVTPVLLGKLGHPFYVLILSGWGPPALNFSPILQSCYVEPGGDPGCPGLCTEAKRWSPSLQTGDIRLMGTGGWMFKPQPWSKGVVTDPVGASWAPTQGVLLFPCTWVSTPSGKTNTDRALCLSGNPSSPLGAQKGFLEAEKLKQMLSVRVEEVARYLRGCPEEESRIWGHLDYLESREVLSL